VRDHGGAQFRRKVSRDLQRSCAAIEHDDPSVEHHTRGRLADSDLARRGHLSAPLQVRDGCGGRKGAAMDPLQAALGR
jgi:hypothetical protein